MLDRHGTPIRIGWQPYEQLWVEAAATLPLRAREAAYADIAALTSRKISTIRTKGRAAIARDRRAAREWLATHLKKEWASCPPENGTARRLFVQTPTMTCPSASKIGREP